MLARVLAVVVCLSVCLSVCLCLWLSHAGIVSKRLNVGSRKQCRVIAHGLCGFLTPTVAGGWPLFPGNLRSKWPTPFRTRQIRPIFTHSVSTESSISTKSKSTTCFPTSHRWTVYVTPKSPKGGTNAILLFCHWNSTSVEGSLLQNLFVWKLPAAKGKVVATSFPYLMVHRLIAGDVPIYLKFALKVTHPFKKRRFQQIRLIVLQPWEI